MEVTTEKIIQIIQGNVPHESHTIIVNALLNKIPLELKQKHILTNPLWPKQFYKKCSS